MMGYFYMDGLSGDTELPSSASIFERRLDATRVRILHFQKVDNVPGEDPQRLECSLREIDFSRNSD